MVKLKTIEEYESIIEELSQKVIRQKEQARRDHDTIGELKKVLYKINPDLFIEQDNLRAVTNASVRKRDEYLCCFCKRNIFDVSTDRTVHHKKPRRYGGTEDVTNKITICADCHDTLERLIECVENAIEEIYKIKLRKVANGGNKE